MCIVSVLLPLRHLNDLGSGRLIRSRNGSSHKVDGCREFCMCQARLIANEINASKYTLVDPILFLKRINLNNVHIFYTQMIASQNTHLQYRHRAHGLQPGCRAAPCNGRDAGRTAGWLWGKHVSGMMLMPNGHAAQYFTKIFFLVKCQVQGITLSQSFHSLLNGLAEQRIFRVLNLGPLQRSIRRTHLWGTSGDNVLDVISDALLHQLDSLHGVSTKLRYLQIASIGCMSLNVYMLDAEIQKKILKMIENWFFYHAIVQKRNAQNWWRFRPQHRPAEPHVPRWWSGGGSNPLGRHNRC